MTQFWPLALRSLFAAVCCLLLVACGGGSTSTEPGQQQESDSPLQSLEEQADPGAISVGGAASLAGGAGLIPSDVSDLPAVRQTAQAGVDFAANRFIVIFESSPQAAALAPYLGFGNDGKANDLSSTDNAPLVQHQYFRRVSANLGSAYGLSLYGRAFYKDLNYAVYELDDVTDIAQVDSAMLKVLSENSGLVREVHYDYFVKAVETAPSATATTESAVPGLSAANSGTPPVLSRDELIKLAGGSAFGLKAAENDVNRETSAAPNDPQHLNRHGSDGGTWANWRVNAVDGFAWNKSTGSENVVVAVLDTGVRMTHEDLAGNTIVPASTAPYNAPGILTDVISKDNNPNDDAHGHGTNCAGCVGAQGNNSVGLAGMCWDVKILPMRVLNNSGSGSDSGVAEAILIADYLGVEIVSMSLGGPFPERTLQLACRLATDDGMLVIAAAGNENTSAPSYPGYYPEVLCVGATTLVNGSNNQDFTLVSGSLPVGSRFDARATFSNYGNWVDIAAPGVGVRTTSRSSDTSYTASTQGTSFSCPYVAGCAALLWGYLDPADQNGQMVRNLLMSGSRPLTNFNNGANPTGFIANADNGSVRFCDVDGAMNIYDDPAWPYNPPVVTWDNPLNGSSPSGTVELRVAAGGGEGTVRKVEFETPTRFLGTVLAPVSGFYRLNWDSSFEFNKSLELIAKAYDDKGNIVASTITVTPNNVHQAPDYSTGFNGLANDSLPAGWYEFDGNNTAGSNTSWGADNSLGDVAAPAMHSSGSSGNYAGSSSDWLFAPIFNLNNHASANISFKRRFQTASGDSAYFIVTADDVTYFVLQQYANGTLQDWATVNHPVFGGGELRAFWLLIADGSSQSGGLWLDDFNLTAVAGSPPTVVINSPLNGATVNGIVTFNVTLSDSTEIIRVNTTPPNIGNFSYGPIPDNDGGSPTKTFTFGLDSRHVYNGGALVTVYAYDDPDNDDQYDDHIALDTVALSVNNATRNPNWFDGFEAITTLGGTIGSNFDGDWFTWSFGADRWRISTESPRTGGKIAKMGSSDVGVNYAANQFDQLYGPVHNGLAAENLFLRMYHKLDVEASTGDVAKILLVRYDGLDDIEIPLAEFRGDTTPAGEWKELLFDVSAYSATPFRVNFLFTSDDDANAGTGWFIDDYELVNANPQITSITDPSGAVGKTVIVNGSGFGSAQGSSTVTFQKVGGGTTTAAVNSWSNTAVSVVVPGDAVSGNVRVTVLGFQSNGQYFGVSLPAPNLGGLDQL